MKDVKVYITTMAGIVVYGATVAVVFGNEPGSIFVYTYAAFFIGYFWYKW